MKFALNKKRFWINSNGGKRPHLNYRVFLQWSLLSPTTSPVSWKCLFSIHASLSTRKLDWKIIHGNKVAVQLHFYYFKRFSRRVWAEELKNLCKSLLFIRYGGVRESAYKNIRQKRQHKQIRWKLNSHLRVICICIINSWSMSPSKFEP